MGRPHSITVFGILNIVFAVFGIFGMAGTLALLSITGASNNPVVKVIRESPTYAMWLKLTMPIAVIACGVLLASGIGLLRLKPWARKVSIGYAIFAFGFGLLGMVMN